MSKNIKGCLSHETDEWATPTNLYKTFIELGFIDPCPLGGNKINLDLTNYYDKKLYVNPPFSELSKWVEWIIKQFYQNNCDIWLLMPARTNTKYFNNIAQNWPEIYFIKGRLHFNDSKKCAPFPTILLHLNYGTGNTYKCSTIEGIINKLKEKYKRI